MKRFGIFLALLWLTGCFRTEITHEKVTEVVGTPYKKLLVCMIAGDAARAGQMEAVMAHRLQRHGVVVDRCTDVFSILHDTTPEKVTAAMTHQNYDAVLIIQRKPAPPYTNLQDFLAAYHVGIPIAPKVGAPIEGVVTLVAVRENQAVWSADGILYGTERPLKRALEAFARDVDNGLDDTGIFPK